MRVLLTGGKGMLGRTLVHELGGDFEVIPTDLPEADITDADAIGAVIARHAPDAVIHCAAMTKVDDCETNEALAFRLNGDGSANVARACRRCGARLVTISTDYVFSGDLPSDEEWRETDAPAPATVYGKSKLAGENYVREILPDATILRIAWLYGAGGPSFVHTMAKLGAQDGAPLKVVDDQRGNPTSTKAVADEIRFLLSRPDITGVVHGTCSGVCTWYGLTVELFRLLGLSRPVVPCTTAEFPRPAPRPANSALAKTVLSANGYIPPPWQSALASFVTAGCGVEFRR